MLDRSFWAVLQLELFALELFVLSDNWLKIQKLLTNFLQIFYPLLQIKSIFGVLYFLVSEILSNPESRGLELVNNIQNFKGSLRIKRI
jgi:hypothetical protein